MKHQESGSSRIVTLATIIVAGVFTLMFFPNLVSGVWKLLAWAFIGGAVVCVGVLHQAEKQKKLLVAKELKKKTRKRQENRKKEKLEQEKRIEKSKEKLALKNAKKAEKRDQKKAEMVKYAETVWAERVTHAKQMEQSARTVISNTNNMDVRTAAGQVVIEWNEATTLAQWTIQQIIMFSERPNVTMQAREEAQDAIIEAMTIKQNGGNWTQKQGENLANIKEKARLEALVEEDRLDTIHNTIEDAELKWRAAEHRTERWQRELDKVYTD